MMLTTLPAITIDGVAVRLAGCDEVGQGFDVEVGEGVGLGRGVGRGVEVGVDVGFGVELGLDEGVGPGCGDTP
ncbi:MAG TPA: hypothetical protein VGK28_00990, partial [Candidatus Dormibacteraeota bacterium]